MKLVQTNEGLFDPAGTLWVPDTIAEWEAIHHWERERLASMRVHLKQGMTLVDVGAEHAWLTGIIAQWVGPENMVLCEPSPEMWADIRYTWEANDFPHPKAIWPGFVGSVADDIALVSDQWPVWTEGADESPVVPYRYLHDEGHRAQGIPTITLDSIGDQIGRIDAITVDVEGAEMLVMQGASWVMERDRPLVWLSVHPDLLERDYGVPNVQDLFDFMAGYGYERRYLGTDHEQHHFFAPTGRRG